MPSATQEAQPCACVLEAPPERAWLDRLALWLEGGGHGEPTDGLLDLSTVLPADVVAGLADIATFYRAPWKYAVRAGLAMDSWSQLCMRVFAALFRQNRVPARDASFAGYEVCQRIYRDAESRAHWDRYARVDGRLERLFVARLAGARGQVTETFVIYGVPVRLVFDARVEEESLVLTLAPLRSSVFAWPTRVSYRTSRVDETGRLHTAGDFRVPVIGIRVRTAFHMIPLS